MSSPDTEFSSNAHASQNRFPLTEFEVPSRHPDLSFPDGNVVVLTGHQYFVVHQGLLFRHSSVLKEMSDDLSSIDTQYLEGRPVLQLPQTPDDMYYFLRVLYGYVFKFSMMNEEYQYLFASKASFIQRHLALPCDFGPSKAIYVVQGRVNPGRCFAKAPPVVASHSIAVGSTREECDQCRWRIRSPTRTSTSHVRFLFLYIPFLPTFTTASS